MSTAPQLCDLCLGENRIASANRPTCPHHSPAGAAWWPAWWMSAAFGESSQERRLAWLKARDGNRSIAP